MRRVCGLDVHKDSIYMCILYENGSKIESVFGVLTPELDKLRDLLVSHHVCEVALESTSIYWIPIWNILSVDFSLKLVNPYFIKQLPGRKSDVKDAEWIAIVLQKGLIRGSYVPDRMIQCLRQYERRNHELSKNIVHAEQRMDMILQRCNIRISNFVSCISCKGYQKVVNAIISGESNPKVLDYVFGVVDNLMTKYPDIAFFKWDCNSPITNIYSVYLKDKQSHLYIDYVRGLYNVLERVKAKYPDLPMMLCSGGGGRSDYEALKYFTEFWPSDNTDPIERLFIQWGFSQVFPVKTMCAHVTTWNKNSSVKFRTDVAMMCKLGFDIKLADMSKDDETYCRTAVQNYNRLKPVVLEGDMYRLISPYGSNHTSTMYVGKDKDKAAVFAFDIHPRYAEKILPVRLQGLDADKMYRVKEINLMPGANSSLSGNGEVFSGEFLMNVGLNLFTAQQLNSRVIEVVAE